MQLEACNVGGPGEGSWGQPRSTETRRQKPEFRLGQRGQTFILRTLRGGEGELEGSVKGGSAGQVHMSERALQPPCRSAWGCPRGEAGRGEEKIGLRRGSWEMGTGQGRGRGGEGLGASLGGWERPGAQERQGTRMQWGCRGVER